MGFDIEVSVPAITVFFQGLLSFLSPCVFPLIPLYIGYLSGGTMRVGEDGETIYDRKKVTLYTIFFVFGVSFAFFVLGLGFSVLGQFFRDNQLWFARIGGIVVVIFGLYQLGIFGTSLRLSKERRLPFRLDKVVMSPLMALIMGFTFSFAWTPCVGPVLASVLLMTASTANRATGFLLIGVYTLGFVIPFLAVGLFTTRLLELFRRHRGVVKYTVKIGGVLMIVMGVMMFTGTMNSLTGYLSQESVEQETGEEETIEDGAESVKNEEVKTETSEELPVLPAIDFTLTDQYGETHTLSQYKGKTIFLNFWATWCPPCRAEMPDIQKLYETYDTEGEDGVIILGIAAPNMGDEGSEEEIKAFLEENEYTYPVLMDITGQLFAGYGIYSFPTTFMIDREGNVFGYVTGQISEEIMIDIIEQTQTGQRKY